MKSKSNNAKTKDKIFDEILGLFISVLFSGGHGYCRQREDSIGIEVIGLSRVSWTLLPLHARFRMEGTKSPSRRFGT